MNTAEKTPRQRWMAALAKAPLAELEAAWAELPAPPRYRYLRRPETGLVMTRGRAGGSGRRFNLGEITVSRCTVQLDGEQVGHAYVAGRELRKAELAAVFDALLQGPEQPRLLERLIEPLQAAEAARNAAVARRAAATRVEFFTMVRGED